MIGLCCQQEKSTERLNLQLVRGLMGEEDEQELPYGGMAGNPESEPFSETWGRCIDEHCTGFLILFPPTGGQKEHKLECTQCKNFLHIRPY
eukprot:g36338.t1